MCILYNYKTVCTIILLMLLEVSHFFTLLLLLLVVEVLVVCFFHECIHTSSFKFTTLVYVHTCKTCSL